MIQESAAEPESRKSKWGIAGWLLIVAAFAIGFVNMPLRVVGWQFDHLPGDAVDNRLNNYILEHGYLYLGGQVKSFWSPPFFYPTPWVKGSSDAHLGMLPLYATLRLAGLSPERAFQGWFVIPFVLNFVAAAWALKRLGAGYAGVATGALLFAFGPPLAGQFGHAQLLPRFLVPPAVVFGWEFLRSPRTYRLAACLACVVYQFYISIYIGYFLTLLLAAGFLVSFIRFRSQLPLAEWQGPGRRILYTRIAIFAVSGLTLLALGAAHSRGVGSNSRDSVRQMAPPPRGWITPPHVAVTDPILTDEHFPREGEHRVSPGFIALLAWGVGLFAVIRPGRIGERKSTVAVAAWSVLLLALFVTVFDGLWLYRPVVEIPGGTTVRAIGRVGLVLLFPIAVALAAGTDSVVGWARRFGSLAAILAGAAIVALVAADQWLSSTEGARSEVWKGERTLLEQVVSGQERSKEVIRRHPAPTLIYAYPPSREGTDECLFLQLQTMRAAQDMGIPCVNGYSGYTPKGWYFFTTKEELTEWLQAQRLGNDKLAGLVLIEESQGK